MAAPDVGALTELHAIQALLADTVAAERALDAELEALLGKRAVRGSWAQAERRLGKQ
jgi:hypothetical protein